MLPTVLITSRVTKPHIVTSSCNNECWGNLWLVHNPTISRVEKSVLEINRSLIGIRRLPYEPWDSEDGQDVTIGCLDFVLLKLKPIFFADICKAQTSIASLDNLKTMYD
jgi:hypothetical protein